MRRIGVGHYDPDHVALARGTGVLLATAVTAGAAAPSLPAWTPGAAVTVSLAVVCWPARRRVALPLAVAAWLCLISLIETHSPELRLHSGDFTKLMLYCAVSAASGGMRRVLGRGEMADVAYVLLTVAVFALLAIVTRGVENL